MANGLKKQKQKWKALAKHKSSLVLYLITILAAAITVFVLGYLIVHILANGIPHLKPSLFAFTYTSDNVSMMPALINTVLMTLATLIVAVPLGIFAAIYLVEYAKKGNKLVSIIRVTAETLTGIPSIVYGLFGMLFFVGYCKWGFSLLSGALTLAIMVLPDSYREGSFGLGAGKLRTVFHVVLPSAVPGILSGVILATGRIVGETAALIYTAGTIAKVPSSIFDSARTLSVHMYNLSKEGLHTDESYATAVVLLVLVIAINMLSNFVARKVGKNKYGN